MNATVKNHFDLPGWTFASVEALGDGDARLCGGTYRQNTTCIGGSTQNHHDISLQGYRGKPVYMCEVSDRSCGRWSVPSQGALVLVPPPLATHFFLAPR